MIKTKKINRCRICNSNNLELVIKLEDMPFTDEFIKKENLGKEFTSNIEIGICKSCGSVQNLNDTEMLDYYNEYTYSVQSSGFAMSFMNKIANKVKDAFFTEIKKPSVFEIGSGTGEQLLEFKKIGFDVLGIEPSLKLSEYANNIGVKTVTDFFDENSKKNIVENHGHFDCVITSYTFDHIPVIDKVLENINYIMNDNGILVIEVHDLDLIIERNEYCLFEHEHYTYLDQETMKQFLSMHSFELVTYDILSQNEKRANSLLVVAKKVKNVIEHKVNIDLQFERIKNLNLNIKKSIVRIDSFLENNKDKTIVAYGAGGRGIMTIAALKKSNIISYIVDKNPKDDDIYAPKSHLEVSHIDRLNVDRADIILVFSFGYYNEIVKEVSEKMSYSKDTFISILDLIKE
jgi:SAM-dependent methyltransferase